MNVRSEYFAVETLFVRWVFGGERGGLRGMGRDIFLLTFLR